MKFPLFYLANEEIQNRKIQNNIYILNFLALFFAEFPHSNKRAGIFKKNSVILYPFFVHTLIYRLEMLFQVQKGDFSPRKFVARVKTLACIIVVDAANLTYYIYWKYFYVELISRKWIIIVFIVVFSWNWNTIANMASTGSEAIMIELMKEGWDWIK